MDGKKITLGMDKNMSFSELMALAKTTDSIAVSLENIENLASSEYLKPSESSFIHEAIHGIRAKMIHFRDLEMAEER